MTTSYPTDMTDEQGEILAPLLPPGKKRIARLILIWKESDRYSLSTLLSV